MTINVLCIAFIDEKIVREFEKDWNVAKIAKLRLKKSCKMQ